MATWTNKTKRAPFIEFLMTESDDYLMTEVLDYIITDQSFVWGSTSKSSSTWTNTLKS